MSAILWPLPSTAELVVVSVSMIILSALSAPIWARRLLVCALLVAALGLLRVAARALLPPGAPVRDYLEQSRPLRASDLPALARSRR